MASRRPTPLDLARAEPLGRVRKNGMRIESEVSIIAYLAVETGTSPALA